MKGRRLFTLRDDSDDEEEGAKNREGFMDDDDKEEDSENLDHFETDEFIVYDEEVEEGDNDEEKKGKQKKVKKRKKRSMKDLVLDDDDIELLQENRSSGICQFPTESVRFKRLKKAGKSYKMVEQSGVSDDEDLLFGDTFGKDEAAYDTEDNDLANFIVDDVKPYGEGSPMRCFKMNLKRMEQVVTMCSSSIDDLVSINTADNEILNNKKQVLSANVKDTSEFEPLFLANKYMTERDNHVEVTDIPERMQMIEEIAGPPPLDEMSREKESAWILKQLAMNSYLLFCKQGSLNETEGSVLLNKIKKEDIMKFLELHHVEKFDIPFIAMYRKEQCRSLLDNIEQDEAENEDRDDAGQACQLKRHKVLWAIKQLDTKWLLLQKRRAALQVYQRKRYAEECLNSYDSERSILNKQLFKSISKSLDKAESKEEIDDIDTKFSLHFPSVDRIDGAFKRPIRRSLYSNCMKAGLWKLASRFGYTAEQLGLQITLEKMDVAESPEYPDESPEEMALNFAYPMFETPELVLKGARHMAALEISCEPCIKMHVRRNFWDEAVVSTCPTSEGNETVDCFHQFSGVKWLREKPLSKFNDAQWLLIQKGEIEKLLQVSIKLPESSLNKLITGFNDVYIIDGTGRYTHLWKEQCKLVLHDAFVNFLLPSMEKEARNLLTSRAKEWLLMEYGKELWKMVSVGPYSCNENIVESAESVAPKVMSCCWGSGKTATTFVMLDSSGELRDVLETRSFNLRSQNVDDQQRKKNDWQRVLNFMKNHRPHVIVIGAANASCVRLKEDVKEIISNLEEHLRDIGQATNGISVVYGDESLPLLYEHSKVSSDQLPEQPAIVKRAVALGRYLQNPLAMVATLCGDNRDIFSLKLNPLDHFLTPDEKYEMIEQVMVDVTNQVGVDVNFAVSRDWYSPLLQFVSGLGPRKASILQKEIVGYRALNSRKELASFGLKTEKVFHNAVGFLRVRSCQLSCYSSDIDLLDCTRIHPESYELAERLANAVCNDITEAAVEYVKKEPHVFREFDINNYLDNELEEGDSRRETFYHIKMELLHGFLDPRKPYKVPSIDEEFDMICGKNGTALTEGRLVQAIVRHVQSQRAFCLLDSGLTGIIMKEDFSDEGGDDFSLQEKLHDGDKVSCKIKDVDKSRCQAFLTIKASEMKSRRYEPIDEVDPYYHEGDIILLNQKKRTMDTKLGKQLFHPRPITHPCFRNMTMGEAMEFLSDKDAGESIFHPSSRGPSYLTLTFKVFDGLYVNKDIGESGKDDKDITSFLHLGKILKIGDDTYHGLDQVMDQYVVPLAKHLKEMLGFRRFKKGSKAEVDKVLSAEKSEKPTMVVYCFGVSYEHPGTFILSYISRNLHHEYVGLLSNGFRFRKRNFERIEHLVGFFQKNIYNLQQKTPTLSNPETGNRSGACTGGDWRGQFNNTEDRSVSRGMKHGDGDENGRKKPGGWSAGAGASGGNWGGNDGPGSGSTGGWGGTKNTDSGGNDGVWQASGNNAGGGDHGPGRRGRGRGCGGGGSNSWGGRDTEKDQNGGNFGSNEGYWHSGGNNSGCGRGGGRISSWGGHDMEKDQNGGNFGSNEGRGGGRTSSWGGHDTKADQNRGNFNGNDGGWRSGGNNGGRGRGGGRSSSWGGRDTEEDQNGRNFGSNEGGRHSGGNNGSRGCGRGGGGEGGWRTGGGCGFRGGERGRGGSRGWGGTKENENGGGECDPDSGGRYGGRTDSWNSRRGGRRGSGNSGRGRDCNNEWGDNSHRESGFGTNSSNLDFTNQDGDNNGIWGKSSGGGSSSWNNNNAGASGGGGDGDSNGGWGNVNKKEKGVLGSKPDSNWGGWNSSGSGNGGDASG